MTRELDVRALLPPEPLVQVLDALDQLPRGETLRAHTPHWPTALLDILATRGYCFGMERFEDGSARVSIYG